MPATTAFHGFCRLFWGWYHCRPARCDASIDKEKDGLYNARRDNLESFWKAQLGKTHALAVVTGLL